MRARTWTQRLVIVGLGTALCLGGAVAGRADEEEDAATSAAQTPPLCSEEDLRALQRRLEQAQATQQKLSQAIDEIKAELAIIKVRVTN